MSEAESADAHGRPAGPDSRKATLWPRLLLEGLVIIASILLAFGLDAAWEDYREQQRRVEYLKVLEDEFLSAAEEMAEQIGDHEKQLAAVDGLLQALADRRGFERDHLMALYGLYYYGPAHPVFTDLANTSAIDVLEFRALRFALFKYGRAKEFLAKLHEREVYFFQEHMEPYLARSLDYIAVMDADEAGAARPVIPLDAELFDDMVFRNMLRRRRGLVSGQLRVDREVDEAIREIQREIENVR